MMTLLNTLCWDVPSFKDMLGHLSDKQFTRLYEEYIHDVSKVDAGDPILSNYYREKTELLCNEFVRRTA